MSDPWAQFRTAPVSPAAPDAAQPGPPQPAAPGADPWAPFRAAPAAPVGAPVDPTKPRDAATVQAEYDAKPWYAQAGQAADDIVRLIANGATFGFADKLAGAANGTGTEAERAKSAEAHSRAGSAGTVAEIGGAIAPAVGLARAGLSLPGLASEVPGFVGAGARTALAGAEGAGYGALDAKGHDRSVADGALLGAIFGAGGNAVGEAAIGGINKLAGAFNKAPVVPTRDEILTQARAAYDAADNAGVAFTPQAVTNLRSAVINELADKGYDPALQPGAKAIIDRLEGLMGQNVTLKGLDTLRQVAGGGFVPGNDKNNMFVSRIIGAIDNAVANPTQGDVLMGDAGVGSQALQTARDLWSRLSKAETIGEAVKRGNLNAEAAGTGWNTENALRQALKGVRLNEGTMRGFKPDEVAALDSAIAGSPDQNLLRWAGRLAPTGIISGGISGGGGAAVGNAIAGPTGAMLGAAAVPALGFGARTAATQMEMNSINRLADIIMGGGTAAAVTAKPNIVQEALSTNRDDLLRAIFGGAQQQAGEANARMRSQPPARPAPVSAPYREAKNGR